MANPQVRKNQLKIYFSFVLDDCVERDERLVPEDFVELLLRERDAEP